MIGELEKSFKKVFELPGVWADFRRVNKLLQRVDEISRQGDGSQDEMVLATLILKDRGYGNHVNYYNLVVKPSTPEGQRVLGEVGGLLRVARERGNRRSLREALGFVDSLVCQQNEVYDHTITVNSRAENLERGTILSNDSNVLQSQRRMA